jgi:hypothetical protein
MSLGLEQNYAQKLLQLAEDKYKCKIWTRSKYDEIVDLMTKETCKEDNTPACVILKTGVHLRLTNLRRNNQTKSTHF